MAIKHADIIIVGAGLIGSALALSLAKQSSAKKHLKIIVVERSSQLKVNKIPNQRVVALGKAATDLLDSVGVLAELGPSFCNPYESMFVWDENSHGELGFTAQAHGLPWLGHMIDSAQCTLLLQREIEQTPSIEMHYNCELERLSFANDRNGSTAQLHFSDGVYSAPLLVAADGGSSWLRQQAKIFVNHRSYQQKGIVARIETDEPHENTAWQRFLNTGPIALLPVENNQSSIVWSVDNTRADQLMALSDDEFEDQLAKALGNKLGRVTLLTKRLAFPLLSQKAESYFTRNVALIGDAAHSIHPLAGQGANLGFKDICALTEILVASDVNSFSDIALLERYQKKRKVDNQQTDIMMSALHHAYQSRVPWWLMLRGSGMNFLNRVELIKSWLVKHAAGL